MGSAIRAIGPSLIRIYIYLLNVNFDFTFRTRHLIWSGSRIFIIKICKLGIGSVTICIQVNLDASISSLGKGLSIILNFINYWYFMLYAAVSMTFVVLLVVSSQV